MRKRSCFVCFALVVSLLCVSCAGAPPWTNGEYLHRYVFWGIPHELSPSDAYKLFPYHSVENGSAAFHFTSAPAPLPSLVEYRDGDNIKRVELDSLLRSTGTHAFIVAQDDK